MSSFIFAIPFIGGQQPFKCVPECSDVLSGSRLSRLYANLVQQDKAYSAVAIPGWPGEKHASALLMSAVPAAGVSLEQLDKMIHRELGDLAASGPTPAELQRIKKVNS